MHPIVRLFGIMGVFMLATVGWLILGAVTGSRTNEQKGTLEGRVADLWGSPQTQSAPSFELQWVEQETKTEQVVDAAGHTTTKKTIESVLRTKMVDPCVRVWTSIFISIKGEKGSSGFPFTMSRFAARGLTSMPKTSRAICGWRSPLPDKSGIYDDFRFIVDGVDLAPRLRPAEGVVATLLPVKPGQPSSSKFRTDRAACRSGPTAQPTRAARSRTSS